MAGGGHRRRSHTTAMVKARVVPPTDIQRRTKAAQVRFLRRRKESSRPSSSSRATPSSSSTPNKVRKKAYRTFHKARPTLTPAEARLERLREFRQELGPDNAKRNQQLDEKYWGEMFQMMHRYRPDLLETLEDVVYDASIAQKHPDYAGHTDQPQTWRNLSQQFSYFIGADPVAFTSNYLHGYGWINNAQPLSAPPSSFLF